MVVFLTRPPATCPLTPRPITSSFRRSGRSPGITWARGGGARVARRHESLPLPSTCACNRGETSARSPAGLPHHLGGEVSRSPRRLTPTCAKFMEEEGTKAGHVTELKPAPAPAGRWRKSTQRLHRQRQTRGQSRTIEGEEGVTPGLYQQNASSSHISSIPSVITLSQGLFIVIMVKHEASAGASAHSARPPRFCSTCQCGFSLPARSG